MAESTPIVVNGVMYVPAGNQVVALDADTGKEIWTHRTTGGNVATRSIGYWPGDGTNPARVLYTVGTNMFALNAATGATDPGFGKEGVVNIEIGWGGAPYVYKNLIIMGNNNGERTDGPAGDTKVYDARTGSELWRFKTMVQPGDKNFEGSWLNDSWKQQRAGLNVWGWYFSVDEATRPHLHAGWFGRRQLLRRRSPRQQSLREFHRRRECHHGQIRVALPTRPPRPVGHRCACRAEPV